MHLTDLGRPFIDGLSLMLACLYYIIYIYIHIYICMHLTDLGRPFIGGTMSPVADAGMSLAPKTLAVCMCESVWVFVRMSESVWACVCVCV